MMNLDDLKDEGGRIRDKGKYRGIRIPPSSFRLYP
jgi:hypothetical protein